MPTIFNIYNKFALTRWRPRLTSFPANSRSAEEMSKCQTRFSAIKDLALLEFIDHLGMDRSCFEPIRT